MTKTNLKVLHRQREVFQPIIHPDRSITWPWSISKQERRSLELASGPERPLDYEHYDRVLEERTIRANKGLL